MCTTRSETRTNYSVCIKYSECDLTSSINHKRILVFSKMYYTCTKTRYFYIF